MEYKIIRANKADHAPPIGSFKRLEDQPFSGKLFEAEPLFRRHFQMAGREPRRMSLGNHRAPVTGRVRSTLRRWRNAARPLPCQPAGRSDDLRVLPVAGTAVSRQDGRVPPTGGWESVQGETVMVETDDYLRALLAQAAAEEEVMGRLRRAAAVVGPASGAKPASPPAVSLMITHQQRADLRARGFSDEIIRQMTPAEAHDHLGVSGRSVPSSVP